MVTRATSYRLRAAAPQPSKGLCQDPSISPLPPTVAFVLQTFKAERQIVDTCDDQDQLLCSNDMLGLGGEYVSASYTAQRFFDPDTNQIVFQASESKEAQIIDEDEVPGMSNL